MRALFIWLGISLINKFYWMIYIFGSFLIFTGIKLWMEKDKEVHPENNPVLKLFNYFFPVSKTYYKNNFFVKQAGRYVATPLFIVLLSIETTDIIFAVDSIPAILAITFDPFIVYKSNIFAIICLRSLFFVLSKFMSLFHYLHYGLSIILIFIGTKMLIGDIYHIPTLIALLIVFAVLLLSVAVSILIPPQKDKKNYEKYLFNNYFAGD